MNWGNLFVTFFVVTGFSVAEVLCSRAARAGIGTVAAAEEEAD